MNIKNSHFNVLIGLNSFIIFFLLFEGSIEVPAFLQIAGRLHPLLLHFPIVLLFICWLLIFFRKQLKKSFPTLKSIVHGLIYISAVLAAITVIMGLLLSKEGGYEGSSYDWHKYSGVALSLLALYLVGYSFFQKKERYSPFFIVGMNLSLVLLLLVGHFGATLTHGDDFLLAPLIKEKSKELDMERAMVFQDAVMPILEAKCMSCHNDGKAKGGLVLADTSSILAGGKNGKLFLAGSPLKSLMIERMLLDIDHKHRMPPKGKPQLTEGEVDILQAWIASGAKFNVPVSALSARDTLLQAIKSVYGFDDNENYDFGPADGELIKKLATPYRVITPLAYESPALNVSFYGRDFYSSESLSELVPIANQMVSLNLSSMPIKKEDVQVLKNFKNLRVLNLNYTALQDEDLASLSSLTNLKSLSLIGTALSTNGLKKLLKMSSIRKVFVWNTTVQESELAGIRQQFPSIYIDGGGKNLDTLKLPLTRPKVMPDRSFFRKELLVSLSHPISGVELRYTLDGSDPDSAKALIYKEPIRVDRNMNLRVKALRTGWLPSQEIRQTYYNTPIMPKRVSLDTQPHSSYRGREEYSFFDLESGGDNYADGRWVGYRDTSLLTNLFFDKPIQLDTLSLSVKQQYNQHIYPPEFIEIWGGADSANTRLLGKIQIELDQPGQGQGRKIVSCPINAESIAYIKLKATLYKKIPEAFPGNGNPSWLFLDEIILK